MLLVPCSLLLVAGCDDGDYGDWVEPMRTLAEEPVGVTSRAVGTDAVFEFSSSTADDEAVAVFTSSDSAEGTDAATFRHTLIFVKPDGSWLEPIESEGSITAAQLRSAVEQCYGKAPEVRTLAAIVTTHATLLGSTTVSKTDIEVKAKLTAPVIEPAYYLVGDPTNWKCQGGYEFKRSQASVDGNVSLYDDPVFTLTIDAPTEEVDDPDNAGQKLTQRKDWYFKVAPQSAFTSEGGDPDWSKMLAVAENGNTALEQVIGPAPNDGAIKQLGTDGALKYKLTLNMMDYKVSIEPLSFEEWIYVPGSGVNSWDPKTAAALHSEKVDGNYWGFVDLGDAFKFTRVRDWKGEYNASHVTSKPEGFGGEGTGNITNATPGLYKLEFNAVEGALQATAISSIGVVGDATTAAWDEKNPIELSRQEDGTWTGSVVLSGGKGYKFVANKSWDINWGGRFGWFDAWRRQHCLLGGWDV